MGNCARWKEAGFCRRSPLYMNKNCKASWGKCGGPVVDACAANNGGCAHKCENKGKSFICSCKKEHVRNADRKTCKG